MTEQEQQFANRGVDEAALGLAGGALFPRLLVLVEGGSEAIDHVLSRRAVTVLPPAR